MRQSHTLAISSGENDTGRPIFHQPQYLEARQFLVNNDRISDMFNLRRRHERNTYDLNQSCCKEIREVRLEDVFGPNLQSDDCPVYRPCPFRVHRGFEIRLIMPRRKHSGIDHKLVEACKHVLKWIAERRTTIGMRTSVHIRINGTCASQIGLSLSVFLSRADQYLL